MKSKIHGINIGILSIWLVFLGFVPLLLLLIVSFFTQQVDAFFSPSFSLASYLELLHPVYLDVLLRSIRLSGITTLACLVLGYPFAWWTYRLGGRSRLFVIILLMIPFWTNSLVRTYAVRMILGSKGLLNCILLKCGLIDVPLRLMYTDTAVILGLLYLMLPFMILPLYANIEKFDFRLVEAAKDLGAEPVQIFRHIIFPLTLPGILAGCTMVFVPSMSLFYVASLLGGAKNLLVGNLIHHHLLVSQNWPLGAAIGVVLMIIMLIMLLGYAYALKRLSAGGGQKTRGGGVV